MIKNEISLLDYFAAQALAGLIAKVNDSTPTEKTVQKAYEYAEMMVKRSEDKELFENDIKEKKEQQSKIVQNSRPPQVNTRRRV